MSESSSSEVALVVDLDGTLSRTDLLLESALQYFKSKPHHILLMFVWLLRGKAHLKQKIADATELDASTLPYNQDFVDYLVKERAAGRNIILATASNIKFAQQVADHIGIFCQVIASSSTDNMSGRRKLEKLKETLNGKAFDYAGNSKADLEVWRGARKAILVAPELGVEAAAREVVEIDQVFTCRTGGVKDFVRACRLYQWVKNVLIFVPLAASHNLSEPDLLLNALLGFLCFGFGASGVYVFNDLLDLDADRQHPRKKKRPFAAGDVSIKRGLFAAPALVILGMGLAIAFLPTTFVGVFAAYLMLTFLYTLRLKSIVLVDVLTLAGLYTIRIIAGGTLVGVPVSFWLLAFSIFLFLSLAIIKRYSELQVLREAGQVAPAGRGYRVADLDTLVSLGTSSGYAAVMVLALYVNSENVKALYSYPDVIWLLCPVALFWVSRMWLKAGRQEMHDDPIVFTVRDPVSRLLALVSAAILFGAI